MTVFYLYPENMNENEFKEMNLLVCWKKCEKSLIVKLWHDYYSLMFLDSSTERDGGGKGEEEGEREEKDLKM